MKQGEKLQYAGRILRRERGSDAEFEQISDLAPYGIALSLQSPSGIEAHRFKIYKDEDCFYTEALSTTALCGRYLLAAALILDQSAVVATNQAEVYIERSELGRDIAAMAESTTPQEESATTGSIATGEWEYQITIAQSGSDAAIGAWPEFHNETTFIMGTMLKGDPFTYEDFSDEQLAGIQAPLIEVAEAAQAAEDERQAAETSRGAAEASRATAEGARSAAESSRSAAEAARAAAETSRSSAEAARELAESERASAESIRQEFYSEAEELVAGKLNISDIAQAMGESESVPMSQAAASTNFLSKYSAQLEDLLAYGIQFDTTISSPTCTRLGNMSLHRTLPIQSKMLGCLLDDDGQVVKYLPSSSWVDSTRDGSQGQVMVEIPEHYRKFVSDGTARQVWISEHPIDGYHKVGKMYVSAYEASFNRTTTTLASVANSTTEYRGGNNTSDWDDTYRSLLGWPVSNISLTNFRAYARKRKTDSTEWNCYTYEAHKTLFWLFVVEYATLNSQATLNTELTSDGYKQGGLGDGPTTVGSTDLSTFNGSNTFIPCGYTDGLGNGTGEVLYEVYDETNDVTISTYANRYRGIENPFGHAWKWVDGILIDVRTDDYDGDYAGQSRVFVASDPTNFASHSTLAEGYEGYEFRGLLARTSNSYIKEVIFGNSGDIISELTGGSSSTFFCDQSNTVLTSSSLRGVEFGGRAANASAAGLSYFDSGTPSSYWAGITSRLCFHPAEVI
ncbi:MAG: hypothetical protein SNH16_07935 [Rikenellaceae bacterium]